MFLLLLGCPLLDKLPNLGDLDLDEYRPTLHYQRMDLQHVDFDGADVDFVFKIENPNPIGIDLSSFSWDLDLDGGNFLDGVQDQGITLKPQGSSKVTIPVSLGFSELLAARDNLSGKDEVPFLLSGSLGFMSPIGEIRIPYSEEGKLPVMHRPKVAFNALKLNELRLADQTAALKLVLDLSHEHGSNLSFHDMSYSVTFDGTKVATGVKPEIGAVEPGATKTVRLPIDVKLVELGTEIVQAIKNRDGIDVGLVADVDVGTPYGKIPLDIQREKRLKVSD